MIEFPAPNEHSLTGPETDLLVTLGTIQTGMELQDDANEQFELFVEQQQQAPFRKLSASRTDGQPLVVAKAEHGDYGKFTDPLSLTLVQTELMTVEFYLRDIHALYSRELGGRVFCAQPGYDDAMRNQQQPDSSQPIIILFRQWNELEGQDLDFEVVPYTKKQRDLRQVLSQYVLRPEAKAEYLKAINRSKSSPHLQPKE